MSPSAIRSLLVSSVAALLLAVSPARAQLDEGAGTLYEKDSYPTQELVRQPLTLTRGVLEVGIPVRIEISSTDSSRVPNWSIPASLDFGISDSVQIGVFHSTGVCLGGSGNDCADAYDDVGGRIRLSLLRWDPSGQLALDARVFAFDFSDAHWTGALGLQYKRTLGANLAILAAADWTTFLNDRDNVAFTDAVAGALGLQLQIFPGLSLFGNVGVDVPLNENAGFDAKVGRPAQRRARACPDPQRRPGTGRAVLERRRRGGRREHGLLPLERFGRGRELTLVNLGRGDERFI